MSYRRTALQAMGQPAIRYLHWVIAHPSESFDGYVSHGERFRRRLPLTLQKLLPPIGKRSASGMDGMHAVVAIQLVGPAAKSCASDLVRLWESDGDPGYAAYNGFPLTLGALGDGSSRVMAALDRHFKSQDPLHRALCAFAMWQLKPKEPAYIRMLRDELESANRAPAPLIDRSSVREALFFTIAERGTNTAIFAPEIRAGTTKALTQESALASWRILHEAQPAEILMRRMAALATREGAKVQDVDRFSAISLSLAEVPEAGEFAKPILREFAHYPDVSAARFASNILKRIERPNEP